MFLPAYPSQELMNEPVLLSCGHSACKAWLLQSITKGRKTCPLCHMILNASNLNPNITVKVLLSKVRVYCTNRGCSWTGQHSEKERHGAPAPFMLVEWWLPREPSALCIGRAPDGLPAWESVSHVLQSGSAEISSRHSGGKLCTRPFAMSASAQRENAKVSLTRAFSLLRANHGSNKSWYTMLSKQSILN